MDPNLVVGGKVIDIVQLVVYAMMTMMIVVLKVVRGQSLAGCCNSYIIKSEGSDSVVAS